MSSINFVDTITNIPAHWANDVDALVYDVFNGAQTIEQAKQSLGFATMAYQDANNVQIVGGSINATDIGLTTPAEARFNTAWLVFEPVNARHAASKNYVDNAVDDAINMILSGVHVQAQVPLAGSGTLASPLRLNVDPVASPTVGTRVLLQRADDSIESVPAMSLVTGSLSYVYDGSVPNTVHLVTHNLGQKYCVVTVVNADTDEIMIPLSVLFLDEDSLNITFSTPTACKAIVIGTP